MNSVCQAVIHLTLKTTSTQIVKMSVTNKSSFQNYYHPDNGTVRTTDTPEFTPHTCSISIKFIDFYTVLFPH